MIIVCSSCGMLLVADSAKRSRRCSYCGQRVLLNKAKLVGSAETAREAIVLVQKLKRRKHKCAN
ncbi:MAG: DUF1922 domain-containing protein [Candidatus Bathyarchaeota archaeon]|nr:MAG: DUF1922 domain-containing protein [Candidatus Bathyarchaeota archaeon]